MIGVTPSRFPATGESVSWTVGQAVNVYRLQQSSVLFQGIMFLLNNISLKFFDRFCYKKRRWQCIHDAIQDLPAQAMTASPELVSA